MSPRTQSRWKVGAAGGKTDNYIAAVIMHIEGVGVSLTGAFGPYGATVGGSIDKDRVAVSLGPAAGYGLSGDRLPFSPKFAATFTADQ